MQKQGRKDRDREGKIQPNNQTPSTQHIKVKIEKKEG